MKSSIVLSLIILAMVNTAFSQTTCTNKHGANAAVTQPTGASLVSSTCSTMVVKWTGNAGLKDTVYATFFNLSTNKKDTISGISSSCNATHNCTATIPVVAGRNVTWYVQSIQVIATDSFYSYPVVGTPVNYPISACGGVTAAPLNNAPVCTGTALKLVANPSGGTPPYTFKWTGPNSFSSTDQDPIDTFMSSASLGTYTVTVKDNAATPTTTTKTTLVSSIYPPVTYTVGHTDAVCYGSATGTLTINNPSSGKPPFTYRVTTTGVFAPFQNPPVVKTNLKAGSYRVYIHDDNGCEANVGPVIGQPPAFTGTYTKRDATCYGTATGSITVTPTSGTAPYTYKLGTSGAFGTSNTFSSLRAGTYRVTIADANNCQGTITNIVITQPVADSARIVKTNVTCYGKATGSITVTPLSGISPFMYKLGTSGVYDTSNTFSALRAGNYIVYIKDANGCIISSTISITQPATAIIVTASKTNETCPGAKDGSITAAGAGGLSPYKYRFGSTGAYGPANIFNNLNAGSYRIYVIDANGCTGGSVAVLIVQTSPTCRPITMVKGGAKDKFKTVASLNANLYPNPTTNLFTLKIHADNKQTVQVRVIDINGRVVYTAKGQSDQPFEFGEQFATGTYLVEVRQGNKVKTFKAIKEK